MKIIVSSKNLKKTLKSIFECESFKVILKHDCIEFFNEDQDVNYRAYGESKDIKSDIPLEFSLITWIKLYNVCKDIEEQPIVLSIDGGIDVGGIMI